MNTKNCARDPRSEQVDHMIRDALRILKEDIQRFSVEREKINDYIMENPDLPISVDQMVFLLRYAYPAVNPKRGDYYDVLARLVSEAKAHGDPQLVKNIYVSVPFFRADQEYHRKREFFEGGIQYFLSLGLHHMVGELYTHLASMWGNTADRIRYSDKALEFLNPTSKEYACIRAMREMLCYIEHQGDPELYHYHAFGETVFSKGELIEFGYPRFGLIHVSALLAALALGGYMILKFYRAFKITVKNTLDDATAILQSQNKSLIPVAAAFCPVLLAVLLEGQFAEVKFSIGLGFWCLMCVWLALALFMLPKIIVIIKYRVYLW